MLISSQLWNLPFYDNGANNVGDGADGSPNEGAGGEAPGKPAGAEGGDGSSKGDQNSEASAAKKAEAELKEKTREQLIEANKILSKKLGDAGNAKGDVRRLNSELEKLKSDPSYLKKFMETHHSGNTDNGNREQFFDASKIIEGGKAPNVDEENEKMLGMFNTLGSQFSKELNAQSKAISSEIGGRIGALEAAHMEAEISSMFAPELRASLDPIVARNKTLLKEGGVTQQVYDYMAAMSDQMPEMLAAAKEAGRKEMEAEFSKKFGGRVLTGRSGYGGRKLQPENTVSAESAIKKLKNVRL